MKLQGFPISLRKIVRASLQSIRAAMTALSRSPILAEKTMSPAKKKSQTAEPASSMRRLMPSSKLVSLARFGEITGSSIWPRITPSRSLASLAGDISGYYRAVPKYQPQSEKMLSADCKRWDTTPMPFISPSSHQKGTLHLRTLIAFEFH